MPTLLPKDSDNNSIPALRFKEPGGAHTVNITSSSLRNTTAFDSKTRIISIYATAPAFIRTGSSSVTSTTAGHYIPAGVYLDVSVGGGKVSHTPYIAVIRASSDGVLYISEKE